MIVRSPRRFVIIPQCIGCTSKLILGKFVIPVLASKDMAGCKFGEFSPTSTLVILDKKRL